MTSAATKARRGKATKITVAVIAMFNARFILNFKREIPDLNRSL